MESRILSLLGAGMLVVFAAAAVAQAPAGDPISPDTAALPEVSEEQLQTFVIVYADLQETARKYEDRMLRVQTEQEAQDLEAQMREESVAKLAERGWTPDEYVAIAQAINADPRLADRARALLGIGP